MAYNLVACVGGWATL